MYYRGAEGAIVVYDSTEHDSFKKMDRWMSELKQYLPQDTPIVIAGNKCDLPNKIIDEDSVSKYAKKVNCQFFPTSAKVGTGVQEIFQSLAEKIIQNQLNGTT